MWFYYFVSVSVHSLELGVCTNASSSISELSVLQSVIVFVIAMVHYVRSTTWSGVQGASSAFAANQPLLFWKVLASFRFFFFLWFERCALGESVILFP